MNQIFKDIRTYFMIILAGILGWILYLFNKYPILSFKYMLIMIIIFLALVVILALSQYKAKSSWKNSNYLIMCISNSGKLYF